MIPYILRPLAYGKEVSLHVASAAAGCVNLCLKSLLHCGSFYCKAKISICEEHELCQGVVTAVIQEGFPL